MNPIVVLPCHKGDFESAKELVAWMNELGKHENPKGNLLIAADAVDRNELVALVEVAKKSFLHVFAIQINVPPNNQGWTKGSDYMFLKVAEWVKRHTKCAFLWMEPDAIPLCPGWLAAIFNEYASQPYRYMGAVVRQSNQPDMPPAHLNGNAAYPNDAFDVFSKIPAIYQGTQAFDIASAREVVPSAFNSPLFQSFWGTPDLPPVFVKDRKPDAPQNHIDFEKFIRPDAVFFHRDKTHSLIPLLREKLKTPRDPDLGRCPARFEIPPDANLVLIGPPIELSPEHVACLKANQSTPEVAAIIPPLAIKPGSAPVKSAK